MKEWDTWYCQSLGRVLHLNWSGQVRCVGEARAGCRKEWRRESCEELWNWRHQGRSHVQVSRRRPTIPKLSAHTTTPLSMTNAYTALTTHGPCWATIHYGIWHFCTFCEQRHDCPGSRPSFQGSLYRKDLEERDSNPLYQRASLLRNH